MPMTAPLLPTPTVPGKKMQLGTRKEMVWGEGQHALCLVQKRPERAEANEKHQENSDSRALYLIISPKMPDMK